MSFGDPVRNGLGVGLLASTAVNTRVGAAIVAYLPTLASAPVYVRANKKLISSYNGFAARAASGPTNLTFNDISTLSSITLIDTAYD